MKIVFVAGERCDPATYHWIHEKTNVPVIDHWWQTESGWPMIANMQGFEAAPVKPGSSSFPVCGYNIQILKEDGSVANAMEQGFVTIKLPLPPGCLPTLWQNNERFEAGYLSQYPGYYFTGDGGYIDEDGYIFITGRVDDVINVAGHRLSTAEMEEITAGLACTAECAVIGANDELKGEVPIAFVVLKDTETRDHVTISAEIKGKIHGNQIDLVFDLSSIMKKVFWFIILVEPLFILFIYMKIQEKQVLLFFPFLIVFILILKFTFDSKVKKSITLLESYFK